MSLRQLCLFRHLGDIGAFFQDDRTHFLQLRAEIFLFQHSPTGKKLLGNPHPFYETYPSTGETTTLAIYTPAEMKNPVANLNSSRVEM